MEGSGGQRFDERPAEIERAQLRERESCLVETTERTLLEHPVALAFVKIVVQREAGCLQRFEVTADRSRRDAGLLRQVVDRQPTR